MLVLPTKENAFRPPVRSVVLKSRTESHRGIRMIEVQSLVDHLRGLEDNGPLSAGTSKVVSTISMDHLPVPTARNATFRGTLNNSAGADCCAGEGGA